MSFTFKWPRFSDQFHYDAIQMLNTALNKGNKPPVIADKIEVVELEMGTQARRCLVNGRIVMFLIIITAS
jgi:distribution and morphology protein 34